MKDSLKVNHEVFYFTHNGIEVEAELCIVQKDDDTEVTVSSYYPENALVTDAIIIREYEIVKDTTMEVFDTWGNV